MKRESPFLCVITDTTIQTRFSHLDLAKFAIRGGADMIQLREKKMKSGELLETASAIQKLCKEARVTFIVNDRVDIALLSGADGVHLGQEDLPIEYARKILGKGKTIGETAGSLEQAIQLEKEGADYIGFGHVFPTRSKDKPSPAKGVAELERISRSISIPVIAIGGISHANLPSLLVARPAGIAVIQAVCGKDNPEEATRELKSLLMGDTSNLSIAQREVSP